jgi:hypothetical protein
MKIKLFAAALAALTLGASLPAAAQNFDRDHRGGYNDNDFRGHGRWQRDITIRVNGRQFSVDRDDRLFRRLVDRPYNFRPGLTYAYSDRCNRFGCIVFVFNDRGRRPIERIFAPHLPNRQYAWREQRGFDRNYRNFGRYDRDERGWSNDDDRRFREGREGRAH